MVKRNIIQITPATGWEAVYDADGVPEFDTLVCWALVEIEESGEVYRAVEGYAATGDSEGTNSCEAMSNFLGYRVAGADTEKWKGECKAVTA